MFQSRYPPPQPHPAEVSSLPPHHTAAPAHPIPISYTAQPFNGSPSTHLQQPGGPPGASLSHAVSPSTTYSASNAVDWQWLDQINYMHTEADRSAAAQHQQHQQQQQQQRSYALHSSPPGSTPNSHLPAGYESPLLHATPATDINPQRDRDRHHYATVIHSIHSNSSRPGAPPFTQPLGGAPYGFTTVDYTAPSASSLALAAVPLQPQPAAAAAAAADGGASATAGSSPASNKRKLARRRKLACGTCRHVKSECSGERPCRRCIRLNKADSCADPTTPYPPKKPRVHKKDAAASAAADKDDEKGAAAVKEESADGAADDREDAGEGTADDDDADMPAKDDGLSPPSSPDVAAEAGGGDELGHAWLSTEMYRQVLPQLAEMFKRSPATITDKSSTGLFYRLGHMFETMPPPFFKQLIELIGYVPVTPAADEKADTGDKKSGAGGEKEKDGSPTAAAAAAAAELSKDAERRVKLEAAEQPTDDTEMPPAPIPVATTSNSSIASTASNMSTSSSSSSSTTDMHAAVSAEDADAAHILVTTASPAASSSNGATSPDTSDPPSPSAARRIVYRSPLAHLPLISMPHRFRFNWKLSPERPFAEQEWVTNFPTLMWYHYPAAAQWVYSDNGLIVPVPTENVVHPIPFLPEQPLLPLAQGQTALLPHQVDLSLTDQPCVLFCNTAAERLFGFTARELKLAFIREGKRAFLRLFDSSIHAAHDADMRKFNGQGQTDFYHHVRVRTKYGSSVRVLMNRKFVVDEDGFVIVNRYTFISLPKEGAEESAGSGKQ